MALRRHTAWMVGLGLLIAMVPTVGVAIVRPPSAANVLWLLAAGPLLGHATSVVTHPAERWTYKVAALYLLHVLAFFVGFGVAIGLRLLTEGSQAPDLDVAPALALGAVCVALGAHAWGRPRGPWYRGGVDLSSRVRSWLVMAGAMLLTLGIWYVDQRVPPQVNMSLVYLIPVLLVTSRLGTVAGLATAAFAGTVHMFTQTPSGQSEIEAVAFAWNTGFAMLCLAGGALLMGRVRIAWQRERELARNDELTGLLNRREFRRMAEREVLRARRSGQPLCLAMIDADGFKAVNDTQGHAAGDDCLRLIAGVLDEGTRRTDVLGRLGGDEFAIALVDTHIGPGVAVLEKIRAEVARRCSEAGFPVSLSVGVAPSVKDDEGLDALLSWADAQLYEAKRSGKNRLEFLPLTG